MNYSNARVTGTSYNSISSTGNGFDSWRNTTFFTQDDNRSNLTDIGFDFWYNGVRYTQFSVSTNGFLDFSNSTIDGGASGGAFSYNNTAFTAGVSGNRTFPTLAPFYDDLTAQGGIDALGNSIKYLTSGIAPNRVLTVEWINMAVYGNTSPSLNFQVKLYENTGVIEFIYGTMIQGSHNFSYTCGLNSQNVSNTAANLKLQQVANSNTFNNTVQNNLVTLPVSNSKITFTPPATNPLVPSGIISFSSVTQTSMQLDWSNWCANEVGYVIYNSVDNNNFNFVAQTAVNATTYSATGLLPGTIYYWRLYAVTEGYLSPVLTGSQTTNAAGNKVSSGTGPWNTAGSWIPNGVPTAADNVTIRNTHTITINVNATCNNLVVGEGVSGVLLVGNNNTPRVLTINGDVLINSGAQFLANTASNTTHNIFFPGNITNNGTVNFSTDGNSFCNTTFTKNGSQTISGSGTVNRFNLVTLNMGSSVNNILDIQSLNFVAPTNFLTLNAGTFKLSTLNASNITPYTAAITITKDASLWLNSAPSTLNVLATLTMSGKLIVSNGIFNVGDAANEDLLSSGGILSVSGGTLNVAGKYYSVGINNLSKFSISGGNVIVPSIGSTNTTIAPFQITGAGSQFDMTGGALIIPREGGGGPQNLGFINTGASLGSVTGGTLQIGSPISPAAQIIQINSTFPIGNLLVNSPNANASLLTNSLNVINDVTINTGTLTANNLTISLGRNWGNNGGTFVSGTGTVNFIGNQAQTIFKSGGETFNHVSFLNSGSKTLLSPISVNNFSISTGSNLNVNTANHQVSIRGSFTNNGTFNTQSGLILFNGTANQSIGGTSVTNFFDLTLNNNAGAILNSSQNLRGTMLLNNGVFNTNGQIFTMVSNAVNTARIGPITGSGDISGNVTVQRFAPGGYTGWALLGTPISTGLTLNDWDDDIPISCSSCPDGSAAGFISIYTYDETQPGLFDDFNSYVPLSGINDPIIPNKGYWVYLGTNLGTTTDITLDVTGPVRKFNNTIPLSYTNHGSSDNDGWNLIHNPYPSPISWTALRNGNPNVENAIYTYNADLNGGTGAYATFVNGISSPDVASGGIGNSIPMCQGFYVHALAPTSLTAQESSKIGGNPTFLKSTGTVSQNTSSNVSMLRLNLIGSGNKNDETVLYMQAGATRNFDSEYDAIKLVGQDINAPAIALKESNDVFQVNGVAPIVSSFSMPLKTTTGYPGTYTISLSNYNSFPTGACINILDTYNNQVTDLKVSNYVFTLSDTTVYPRFVLNITIEPLDITSNLSNPSCSEISAGYIFAKGNNAGPWNYYWKDANGNSVKTSLNKNTADTLSDLSGGVFVLDINTVGMCDNNQSEFTIDFMQSPVANFSAVDTVFVSNGTSVSFNNQSENSILYTWDFGDGTVISNQYNPTHEYFIPGTYTVALIAESSTGCLDTTQKQIVVYDNTTSISQLDADKNLILKTMKPNQYVLIFSNHEFNSLDFTIYDVYGKLVYNIGTVTSKHVELPVNLENLNNGIYFLNIIGDKSWVKTIKLPVSK